MAPTFRPGRKTRIWCNSLRLSRVTDTYDFKRGADTIETTVHEDDDKTFIAGLRMGDVSFGGLFDGTTAGAAHKLQAIHGSTVDQAWSFTPEGDAVGARCWLWASQQSQFAISSPANGRVSMNGGSSPSKRIYVGKSHVPGTVALTSTGAQAAIDSGSTAGTTGGSMANFHLTDQSTLASITVKIQHSSNASLWADLYTFTSTSTGFQQSTGTATVKRHTRGIVTALTGGAGKSVNVLASFGRTAII